MEGRAGEAPGTQNQADPVHLSAQP
jgi:hypothetical protein